MKTTRLNYKTQELLQEENLSKRDIQLSVEKTKLQLQADILATKSAVAEKEDELYEIKTTYPLDTERYVEVVGELSGLKEGLQELHNLQKEFGWE